MENTGIASTVESTFTSNVPSGSSTCGSGVRRRAMSTWPRGYWTLVSLVIVLVAFQLSTPVWSASLNKRSADQSEEVCRNNAICGWEVYHPSTRNLQYYVASSCKCSQKDACLRSEDDISISAYVFRCRDGRKRKTTPRPTTDLNETS